MEWQEEKALMQREFVKIKKELHRQHSRAAACHDKMIAEIARAHDMRVKLKSAQNGLARCEVDARRYQWLRKMGVRFPGIEEWLHGRDADSKVDGGINRDGYMPSQTEVQATKRRPRDPDAERGRDAP